MLSQKTRYAIRAMQFLADRYGDAPVHLSEIAAAQRIPAKYLTVILSELSRFGIVASFRRARRGLFARALARRYQLWGPDPRHARFAGARSVREPLRA
jgi:Rrf2 family protein